VLYVADYLRTLYPTERDHVVAPNVEIPTPLPAVLRRRLIRTHGHERLVIGTIASLDTRYKGLDTALKALFMAASKGVDYEYRILGSGDGSRWKDMATEMGLGDRVVFTGTRPSGEPVYEWLDDVDVYIQPSLTEGMPRALIEAMSRGCYCLASSVGGIPELLDKECTHAPGDARRLAELICQGALDPKRRAYYAERNHTRAALYSADRLGGIRSRFWRGVADSVRAGQT